MIPTWLITAWASKLGRPLMIGGGIVLLLLLVFALGRCTGGNDTNAIKAQADQTNRSSEAIADAASDAVTMLEHRTATEDAIDQVVSQTVDEINGAQSPDAVRAAVLAGVCSQPSHRNDPACITRPESHP